MRMVEGNSVMDFYMFWHWQYIRRNKNHVERHLGNFNIYAFNYIQDIVDFESQCQSIITSSTIIERLVENSFHYIYPDCINYDSIHVLNPLDLNYKEDEIIDYGNRGEPIYSGEKSYIESCTHLIAIDINANKETVLADIAHLLDKRDQSREKEFIKSKGISIADYNKPHRDRARAIGLWLWDRVKELGGERGTVKEAIEDLHKKDYLPKLGLAEVEDADLRFYHRRTKECIINEEVLPFTKRGIKR